MQSVDLALQAVLILSFLTLYGTVAWGLLRYSAKQSYRYWALGWIIYSIGGLQAGFSSVQGLVPLDLVGIFCIFSGSTLILHGTNDAQITKKQVTTYVVCVVAFLTAGIFSLFLKFPYYLIFGILGFYVMYVCFLSVKTVYGFKDVNNMSKIWLISGLMLVGFSWLIFPSVAISSEFYFYIITIQAAGVIITGASMLIFFIHTVTQNLEQQYQASQIMSSLIQHDIRNYIHVAQSALDLAEGNTLAENHWFDIASESLEDASRFINQMRDIYGVLSRQKLEHQRFNLAFVINHVLDRVVQEYSLDSSQIDLQISQEIEINTCSLFSEILWNIFDNAFKHGTKILHIDAQLVSSTEVVMEISDRSGGLSEDVKDFLNSPTSLSHPVAPGLGLGLILIKGLSQICEIHLYVEDVIETNASVGTKFVLSFPISNDSILS